MIKSFIRQLVPPILWRSISVMMRGNRATGFNKTIDYNQNPQKQDLDLNWDPDYAKVLEEWGKNNTWNEIQMILCVCKGRELDIACGTGVTIKLLERYPYLELYGFDISDLLIQRAIEKGIPNARLKVADATKTN